jgi:hypothetical protein
LQVQDYINQQKAQYGEDYDLTTDTLYRKYEQMKEQYFRTTDRFIFKFFDPSSMELLDDKIEVLSAIIEGKSIWQIPKDYRVLELYPPPGEMWD